MFTIHQASLDDNSNFEKSKLSNNDLISHHTPYSHEKRSKHTHISTMLIQNPMLLSSEDALGIKTMNKNICFLTVVAAVMSCVWSFATIFGSLNSL